MLRGTARADHRARPGHTPVRYEDEQLRCCVAS